MGLRSDKPSYAPNPGSLGASPMKGARLAGANQNFGSSGGIMTYDLTSHTREVARIAELIRSGAASGGPVRIEKGGVSHFVPVPGDPRDRAREIDARRLRRVLSIDTDKRICIAEPGVTFKDLVSRT